MSSADTQLSIKIISQGTTVTMTRDIPNISISGKSIAEILESLINVGQHQITSRKI